MAFKLEMTHKIIYYVYIVILVQHHCGKCKLLVGNSLPDVV